MSHSQSTAFDEGYQLAVQASDELAERMVQLGANVDASLSGVQTLSNLNIMVPENWTGDLLSSLG